ncbi:hypothetical protein OEA41_000203 [Lepraria neglecta]|uniref:Cytochrome P450 n=1 Tax=Lepraria neglecta TaxID=209136 RepID=A0AAD9ZGQ9_9LECA|nr:hypothetical protein OEA41_000203 [Lepraria neglecta]
MQAKGADGDFVSPEDVKTEILALLIATTDTTAAFICAFINHILDNADVMTKLTAEIREHQTQGQLTSPVVSFRSNTLFHGLSVRPYDGHRIGANPYVINRDRSVFGTDADDFRPERWFRDLEKTREMHKWMFTWGWGPRDCVGRHFARVLAQKLLFQVCFVSFQI